MPSGQDSSAQSPQPEVSAQSAFEQLQLQNAAGENASLLQQQLNLLLTLNQQFSAAELNDVFTQLVAIKTSEHEAEKERADHSSAASAVVYGPIPASDKYTRTLQSITTNLNRIFSLEAKFSLPEGKLAKDPAKDLVEAYKYYQNIHAERAKLGGLLASLKAQQVELSGKYSALDDAHDNAPIVQQLQEAITNLSRKIKATKISIKEIQDKLDQHQSILFWVNGLNKVADNVRKTDKTYTQVTQLRDRIFKQLMLLEGLLNHNPHGSDKSEYYALKAIINAERARLQRDQEKLKADVELRHNEQRRHMAVQLEKRDADLSAHKEELAALNERLTTLTAKTASGKSQYAPNRTVEIEFFSTGKISRDKKSKNEKGGWSPARIFILTEMQKYACARFRVRTGTVTISPDGPQPTQEDDLPETLRDAYQQLYKELMKPLDFMSVLNGYQDEGDGALKDLKLALTDEKIASMDTADDPRFLWKERYQPNTDETNAAGRKLKYLFNILAYGTAGSFLIRHREKKTADHYYKEMVQRCKPQQARSRNGSVRDTSTHVSSHATGRTSLGASHQ